MRSFATLLLTAALPVLAFAQTAPNLPAEPDAAKKLMLVEASCGECNFDLPGEACDLAVRLPDGTYYVDGAGISDFGHPHDKNGFCVAVRKAEVQGEVVDGRFKASYFKLLPSEADQGKPSEQGR